MKPSALVDKMKQLVRLSGIWSHKPKKQATLPPVTTGDEIVDMHCADDLLAASTKRIWLSPEVDSWHWVLITPEEHPSYYSGNSLTQEGAEQDLQTTAVYHLSKSV